MLRHQRNSKSEKNLMDWVINSLEMSSHRPFCISKLGKDFEMDTLGLGEGSVHLLHIAVGLSCSLDPI